MPNPDLKGNEPVEPTHVRVWDAPTRIFHWLLVALVAFSWFTADNGLIELHLWSGLTLLTLLLFRIGWGLVGSTTSRFSDFVTGPGTVFGYLRALTSGHKPLHAGHNPAGGWMVVTLMTILVMQASIGLFANDSIHFNGPLATVVSTETSDRLTELHGTIFNFILLFAWMHVVAVFFYLCVKGENLIGPILHGKKHGSHVPADLNLRFAPLWIALLLFASAAGIVWWIARS